MEPRRPYKVLCVSSLHPKASDDVVRDTLYREFKKYGDISVRVVLDPDGRVAYVYFRNFDDARDARHSKSRIILFDKPAVVEPVYESRSETSSSGNYNHSSNSSSRRQQQRSVSPPPYSSSRYRSRSPPEYSSSSSRYRGDNYRDDYHSSSRDYHREPSHRSHSSRDYESHERGRGRGSSHHHGDDHRGGGGHRGGRGGYQGSRPNKYDRDNKKDKFPNYLDHIQPEDDPLATRTLFTGNLELNITEEEIRRIFGRYGNLLDVDIKRPPPGTGNAYAFIRYENLDMSHRAKVELSGQYIGKFQCKIGYGKVHATTKVWVGGLGCWCSPSLLWKEFDRFGAIKEVEYREGDSQAHVQYENIDAAQAAVQEMRGHPLGGPDKRLRIDFADLDVVPSTRRDLDNYDKSSTNGRSRAGGRGSGGDRGGGGRGGNSGDFDRRDNDYESRSRRSESGEDYSPRRSSGNFNSSLANVNTVADLGTKTPKVWDGGLILKNSIFPTKLHVVEGDRHIADSLKDETGKFNLKITQRLRLDQPKLEDVTKRMNSSRSHGIFLGLPTTQAIQHENPDIQSRPLRNLISYLKQKEAAGVISLTASDSSQGVLYCFPPCSYAQELLRREATDLADETAKDEFLVVVVVCGASQ